MASAWEKLPNEPTAQRVLPVLAMTPASTSMAPSLGLATGAQVVPFQCSRSPCESPGVEVWPTAQALLAEVTATPASELLPPGLGLGTWAQAVPFQRRVRVWNALLVLVTPTAHALVADEAPTPNSSLSLGPGLGVCCGTQEVPSQCRMSVVRMPALSRLVPTAQALLAEVKATPDRSVWPASVGL